MKQEIKSIPPLNDPPIGIKKSILHDGRLVEGNIFHMRGHNGIENYIVIYPPNTRPFTRISVFKDKDNARI